MKKLIAVVLIALVALNIFLLWAAVREKSDGENAASFKLPALNLNEPKPGLLPCLLHF